MIPWALAASWVAATFPAGKMATMISYGLHGHRAVPKKRPRTPSQTEFCLQREEYLTLSRTTPKTPLRTMEQTIICSQGFPTRAYCHEANTPIYSHYKRVLKLLARSYSSSEGVVVSWPKFNGHNRVEE
jgi:hypothetical protein